MNAFEIAGLVALLAMAAAIMLLLRRDRSRQGDAGLVETWKVGFDASPIATIVRQNGVYVHCNDAAVRILGARDKAHVLEVGPAKITPERQPDGRLTTDIFQGLRRNAQGRQDVPLRGIDGTYA